MRDKDLVAAIALLSFAGYYFSQAPVLKFIFLSPLIFFIPGFFLLKILYRNMALEELILLSFGVAIGVSWALALAMAALNLLTPEFFIAGIFIISIVGYFFSETIEIEKPRFTKPDTFTAVMLVLMLVLIAAWGYHESQVTMYREMDLGIVEWPHNATLNDTLNFTIYVANQNYGEAHCKIVFYMNSHKVAERELNLTDGEHALLNFSAHTNVSGKNIASFNLYANGKYFTNVHVYFEVRKE